MKTFFSICLASVFSVSLLACSTPAPPKPYAGPILPIAQIDRGVQIVLPDNVLFESGKSVLNLSGSQAYLERIAQIINQKTVKQVAIEGHTDALGAANLNQKLSDDRAIAVRDILLSLKVPAERMTTTGYSFERPVASNATEDGRKFNRRTEIIILDEKIENITKGEAENSFEAAFSRLKSMVEQGLLQAPAK
ncbi:hypothetical protein BH11PSE12_BH11PSE12_12560 [soil metagenome]